MHVIKLLMTGKKIAICLVLIRIQRASLDLSQGGYGGAQKTVNSKGWKSNTVVNSNSCICANSQNLDIEEGAAKLSRISILVLSNLVTVGLKSLRTTVCPKVFSRLNMAAMPLEARHIRGIPCPENPASISCPGLLGTSPTYGIKSELNPMTKKVLWISNLLNVGVRKKR